MFLRNNYIYTNFFLCRLLCLINHREEFLTSAFLFYESCCGNPLLNVYCIYFRRTFAAMNCVYTLYLIDISFSKEHLQPYIWVVPSFFQKATRSDLVFSMVLYLIETRALTIILFLKYIKLICHSSCSHPFHKRSYFCYKRAIAATYSFKFVLFQNRRSCSKKIS